MTPLFDHGNEGILLRFRTGRVLLAFDFDGTLAPLFTRPGDARMSPRTRALFQRLCERAPCVVISGRARDDLLHRLDGARVREAIGNHGIEPGGDIRALTAANARLVAQLSPHLTLMEGVELEDKGVSHSWHYRLAASPHAFRSVFETAMRSVAEPARVVPGKCVFNVVPADAPDKGRALKAMCDADRIDSVLFAGDDVTDEDVFRRSDLPGLVSIHVGLDRASAATYALRDQAEMDRLLESLLDLRG